MVRKYWKINAVVDRYGLMQNHHSNKSIVQEKAYTIKQGVVNETMGVDQRELIVREQTICDCLLKC